jgi:hypothetical protein
MKKLAEESKVLGENLRQCHFTTNPTWSDLGSNPGSCGGKPVYVERYISSPTLLLVLKHGDYM